MPEQDQTPRFFWHESAGARILLPSQLALESPFPGLYATTRNGSFGIIVTITSNENERRAAERMIRGPHRSAGQIAVKTLREGAVHSPFLGVECIVQNLHLHKPVPDYTYFWARVLYLDEAYGVTAHITASGSRAFQEDEGLWQTVMESFSWDREQAVVLKYDGDQVEHYRRFRKKKTSRAKRVAPPLLPAQLSYLQAVMDELMSLPPDEVNEDFDLSGLDKVLRERLKGLPLQEAKQRLTGDCRALKAWIDDDREGRSVGEFIIGVLYGFDVFGLTKEGEWSERDFEELGG